MKQFFSIVIPTLNEEKFLPQLLDDLASQTEHDFEVIIVDGNSEDRTREVIAEHPLHSRIHTICTQKRSVAYQRNLGAERAHGEYIFFIDADTRIPSQSLTIFKKIIEKNKFLLYLPQIIPERNEYFDVVTFHIINYAVELSQYTEIPFSTGGTFAIENHYFSHLGGFDEKLYLSEDHDIVRRARRQGVKAFYTREMQCIVSLRRLERDGILDSLYKYSVAFLYTLAKGKVDKEIVKYEMGGHLQNRPTKKQFLQLKTLYQQLMKILLE